MQAKFLVTLQYQMVVEAGHALYAQEVALSHRPSIHGYGAGIYCGGYKFDTNDICHVVSVEQYPKDAFPKVKTPAKPKAVVRQRKPKPTKRSSDGKSV